MGLNGCEPMKNYYKVCPLIEMRDEGYENGQQIYTIKCVGDQCPHNVICPVPARINDHFTIIRE